MDFSSAEIKQIFRSIYSLVKTLDERKVNVTTVQELFGPDVTELRQQLVQRCEILLFEDLECVGKKSREIMWRKGYYDVITTTKKLWKITGNADSEEKEHLQRLLLEGINRFKYIILNFERKFNLDLKLLLNFKLLNDVDKTVIGRSVCPEDETMLDEWQRSLSVAAQKHELYTVNERNYTLATIHSLLISLGDLHRYYLDFGFARHFSKDDAAQFYTEAFKLDPGIGMAHNQLGTLLMGRNYDLDSVYHYLQSLVSSVPFELSVNNVNNIFQQNAVYLERDVCDAKMATKHFMAHLLLVIDVFFFDKDVTDFNALCQYVLMNLKVLIISEKDENRSLFTTDLIYKIVACFFFCLLKLRAMGSKKVHSLNAFMVGMCLTLVEVCLGNLERHIGESGREIEKFSKRYKKMFEAFDRGIKENREKYRNGQLELKGLEVDETLKQRLISNGHDESFKNGGGSPMEGSSIDEKSLSNKENRDADNQLLPKKPPEPVKSSKKCNLRRRRRRFNDSEYESDDDSNDRSDDAGMDSDSSDSLSCFDSSDSESVEEAASDDEVYDPVLAPEASNADSDDIVVEEETIIYNSGVRNLIEKLKISPTVSSAEDFVIEEETIIYPESGKEAVTMVDATNLKYRKVYEKISPNVIIEFVQTERTMRALKVIFDWLRLTPDILVACYVSNPEFIHKIMKLINIFNIDIFTRKVYFERSMVTVPGLRDDLVQLFDIRHTIPTAEDVLLKRCVLVAECQEKLDWEVYQRLQVTDVEENLLRMLKFVDFGFCLTKMRKFNYSFCTKTRNFVENLKKGNGGQRQRRGRNAENGRRREKEVGETRRQPRRRKNRRRNERRFENGDDERVTSPPPPAIQQRKGYLKNKTHANGNVEMSNTAAGVGGSTGNSNASSERESNDETKQNEKNELMGKLWLRNEVKTLEKMQKPMSVQLTPYIVLDTKCLSDYTSIVKNLVKTKAFVVLIPKAVLSELDDLKKSSEGVRTAIKWLEMEFKKGNRFLRSQRNNETLMLPLIKIKKKMDREASTFLQIAQFCNHIATNYADCDATTTTSAANEIVTVLTGDHLREKKNSNFSYTGLLESIPVKYDQIVSFYSNYKKK